METVVQKINGLKELQSIDTDLYELKKLQGALPEEMRDLEDGIAGLETRRTKIEEELKATNLSVVTRRNEIKEAEAFISKCEEQYEEVRNNRQYDSITKQIELKQLEIQLSEKRIKEEEAAIAQLDGRMEEVDALLAAKRDNFEQKKKELEVLVKESEVREADLQKSRTVVLSKMEDDLKLSYQRLLDRSNNGLAVVSVKKDACGGCFSIVPPQRQVSIKERRKLVVCEHCGRVLAEVEASEEEPKPKRSRKKVVKQ